MSSRKRALSPAGVAYKEAARDKLLAAGQSDPLQSGWHAADAKRNHLAATQPLTVEGARALGVPAREAWQDGKPVLQLLDTSRNPAPIAAEAHLGRLKLVEDAGCLEAAVEMSATILAANSLEKSLAHQIAAAHAMAMKLIASADRWLGDTDPDMSLGLGTGQRQGHARAAAANVEAVRLVNAAARMMGSFNEGIAALSKLRHGGQQDVQVTHTHVHLHQDDHNHIHPAAGETVVGMLPPDGSQRRGRGRKAPRGGRPNAA